MDSNISSCVEKCHDSVISKDSSKEFERVCEILSTKTYTYTLFQSLMFIFIIIMCSLYCLVSCMKFRTSDKKRYRKKLKDVLKICCVIYIIARMLSRKKNVIMINTIDIVIQVIICIFILLQ